MVGATEAGLGSGAPTGGGSGESGESGGSAVADGGGGDSTARRGGAGGRWARGSEGTPWGGTAGVGDIMSVRAVTGGAAFLMPGAARFSMGLGGSGVAEAAAALGCLPSTSRPGPEGGRVAALGSALVGDGDSGGAARNMALA
jgi:hypothetical protein